MLRTLVAFTVFNCCVVVLHAGLSQLRLINDLLEPKGIPHNVLERPAANDNETVTVQIAFNIQQVINLDVKQQYLESLIWIEHYWTDARMRWNPVDYGGITKIRLPPTKLWRPDITMYNSADQKFDGTWPVNMIVDNLGSVSYIPPAMLKSTCKVNVKWFPFDEQCCALKFGSWTYDDKQVNLTLLVPDPIRKYNYVKNGEFDLAGLAAKRFDEVFEYAGIVENYPYVMFCMHLQRLALYYVFNLIVPAVLILSMSLTVFVLPAESGEKMGLSITVLLSLSVFTLVVAESLPRTSESTPLLGLYFTIIMFFCSIAVVASVIILNLHYFPDLSRNPPEWIRYGVCCYMSRFLLMRVPRELQSDLELRKAKKAAQSRRTARCTVTEVTSENGTERQNNLAEFEACLERLRNLQANASVNESPTISINDHDRGLRNLPIPQDEKELLLFAASLNVDSFHQFCSVELYLILKELKVLASNVRSENRTEKIALAWRFAAAVFDRLMLYLFMIITIICACVVLIWRPRNVLDQHISIDCPCTVFEF